jgi:hypothetical protein
VASVFVFIEQLWLPQPLHTIPHVGEWARATRMENVDSEQATGKRDALEVFGLTR